MQALPDRLAQAQPGTTETTLFTAAARTTLAQAVLCNVTASPLSVTLKLVPVGATPGGQHALLDTTVAPKATVVFDFAQVLRAGDFLSASAGAASSVTFTVSGVVMT